MKVTVKINDKICIGSGNCTMIAAEVFELNEQGKAIVKDSSKQNGKEITLEITNPKMEFLLEAARACPVQAISITDENGEKILT